MTCNESSPRSTTPGAEVPGFQKPAIARCLLVSIRSICVDVSRIVILHLTSQTADNLLSHYLICDIVRFWERVVAT